MKRSRISLLPLLAVGGIFACSSEAEKTAPRSLAQGFAEVASPAQAEAVGALEASLHGVTPRQLASAQLSRIEVIDFDGRPFQNIVHVVGMAEGNPLCDSGNYLVATGATHAQMPTSWGSCHGEFLDRLQAVDEVLDSPRTAIIATSSSTYLVKSANGTFYDLMTAEALTEGEVATARAEYASLISNIDATVAPELMESAWELYQLPEDGARFVRDDGSFDLALAAENATFPDQSFMESLQANGTDHTSSEGVGTESFSAWSNPVRVCFFFCVTIGHNRYESGQHARPYVTQAHWPEQRAQNIVASARPFAVSGCATQLLPLLRLVAPKAGTSNVAGCAPAAFASLAEWLWRRGRLPNFDLPSGVEMRRDLDLALFASARHANAYLKVESDSIRRVGACGLGASGTVVFPGGFEGGARSWLSANAPGVTLTGDSNFGVPPFTGGVVALLTGKAHRWAGLFRGSVGIDRAPAIAMGNVGGLFDYHYSPIASYNYSNPLIGFAGLSVRTIDGYTINLVDPFSFAVGAYSVDIEGPSGCRFENSNGTVATSCNGPIPGYACVNTEEPADPNTWGDNYICTTQPVAGTTWSYTGPQSGSVCKPVQPADPHAWSDNYICTSAPNPYRFSNGASFATNATSCARWNEPADPHGGWNAEGPGMNVLCR